MMDDLFIGHMPGISLLQLAIGAEPCCLEFHVSPHVPQRDCSIRTTS